MLKVRSKDERDEEIITRKEEMIGEGGFQTLDN